MTTTETRQERGLALYREPASRISEVEPGVYRVPSCSGGGFYRVDIEAQTCECPVHQHRSASGPCKHVLAATIYAAKRRCRRSARRPSRRHDGGTGDRRQHGRPQDTPRRDESLRDVHADPDRLAERLGV